MDDISSRSWCEVPKVWALVDEYVSEARVSIECITEHPQFESSCLNNWTLQAVYQQLRKHHGRKEGPLQ